MKIYARFYHRCDDPWAEAPAWALEIRERLDLILDNQENIMTAMDDALASAEAAAKENNDADDAAEKLLVDLSKMVADLKAAGTDPATAARVQAFADALRGRAGQLAAAVVAGTPAA